MQRYNNFLIYQIYFDFFSLSNILFISDIISSLDIKPFVIPIDINIKHNVNIIIFNNSINKNGNNTNNHDKFTILSTFKPKNIINNPVEYLLNILDITSFENKYIIFIILLFFQLLIQLLK